MTYFVKYELLDYTHLIHFHASFPKVWDEERLSILNLPQLSPIFDVKTGELLGAHMVGAEVTELIQGYVLGQKLETTEEDLISTVFPHPTLSEMMHESVLDAYNRAIHI